MNKILIALFALVLISSGCHKAAEKKEEISIDMSDVENQRTIDARDKADLNVLYKALSAESAQQRYLAALCIASLQEKNALDVLKSHLNDEDEMVRAANVFAIGMLKQKEAISILLEQFSQVSADTTMRNYQAAILEAVGRCGSKKDLYNLATAKDYYHPDTKLLLGQVYGIFRFQSRDSILEEGTRRMIELACSQDVDIKVRRVAGNYLFRLERQLSKPDNKSMTLTTYEPALREALKKEPDAYVRSCMMTALSACKTNSAKGQLLHFYDVERDYRVKVSIIKGLKHFAHDSVSELAFKALQDPNLHVRLTAAEYFYQSGGEKETAQLLSMAQNGSTHWQVKTKLYAAVIHNSGAFKQFARQSAIDALESQYNGTGNVYEKAAIFEALAESPSSYEFILEKAFPADSMARVNMPKVIVTSATEQLCKLLAQPNGINSLGFNASKARKEIFDTFRKAIESGDAGVLATIGDAFSDPATGAKAAYPDFSFMLKARDRLKIPQFIESWINMNKAVAFMTGTPPAKTPTYPFSTDWTLFQSSASDITATVETNKGSFTVRLRPDIAPSSVINFVSLAKTGFFNGKIFHRVVSNFVVQVGCNRGDGYGGMDKGLRTEISMAHYDDEGILGMASAGRDTEGTQWFVTTAPALHLDGGYTIFGKVTKGMEVIHNIEQGDRIVKIDVR